MTELGEKCGRDTEKNSKQSKKGEIKLGDFPDKQEAAPLPETINLLPLNDLSPSQTRSQPLLHFTISVNKLSIHRNYYHPISSKELAKLNRYAHSVQQVAQWYLSTIADSHIIYLYQDENSMNCLKVSFGKDKFMHLTGIYPYKVGQTAEKTLLDFANGRGHFSNILIANKGATFDKLKVLPELSAIVEASAFYFGDLSDVPKLKRLDMCKAICSLDKDVVLAMRTIDGVTFPASLMKLRDKLNTQFIHSQAGQVILGVYRERNGLLEQISINQKYIKDNGKELMTLLKKSY